MYLIRDPTPEKASTSVGSIRCLPTSAIAANPVALSPAVLIPETGSICKSIAKILIISNPKKNAGIDIPIRATTVAPISNFEYCLVAEIMPIGTANIIDNKYENADKINEFQT